MCVWVYVSVRVCVYGGVVCVEREIKFLCTFSCELCRCKCIGGKLIIMFR